MKKSIVVMAMALLCAGQVNAQRERMNPEEMQKARAEMVKQNAERLAKDFELKDDAKTAFIEKYTQYQNDLFADMRPQGNREEGQREERKKTSEMSDEEVTALIQSAFERQEKQIEAMQKRLEVQKKYYAEFSKTLSPKQLIRIFGQQRPQGQRQGQGQNQGQRGGFGGGRGGFGGGGFGGPGGF
ncbi:MAG: hypothetical protein K5945_10550 [Bacteroidaceae bacterium]|nr:hypothetical protein [Bacteroidaceae bacterium]